MAIGRSNTITVELVGDRRQLQRTLLGAERDVSGLGSKLKTIGKVIGAALVATTAAVAAGIAYSVNKFTEFETGMREVFTLLPGISEKAMTKMQDQVLDLANEMNILPEEIVPALYQALSAGVPQGNVMEFLRTSSKLAKGGVTDLETAVDGLSSVVNAYGAEAISAERASDVMFTTVKLGKTTVEELSGSLGKILPLAAANNVAFEDIGAALAQLTSVGISTQESTTFLRSALKELGDSGKGVGEEFEKVAGVSFRKFMAEGNDLGDAMQVIEQISKDTGIPIDQLFSSIEAGTAIMALTGDNTDAFNAKLDEMSKAAGATDEAYATMKAGMQESFDSLKVALDVIAIKVGREFAPLVGDAADLLDEHADEIADAIMAIAGVIVDFIKNVAIPALITFGETVEDVVSIVGSPGDGVPKISSAVAEHLGVKVPDTLSASGKEWKLYAQQVEQTRKDGIQSFSDLTDTLKSDALTFGEKFGIIWNDIWSDNTKSEQRNLDRAYHIFSAQWARDMDAALNRWGLRFWQATSKLWNDIYKTVRNRLTDARDTAKDQLTKLAANAKVQWFVIKLLFSRALNDIYKSVRDRLSDMRDTVKDRLAKIGTNTKTQWFVIKLIFSRALSDIRKSVTTWGSNLVSWFKGLPGRITSAMGNIGAKIKDKFSSLLKGGLKIPLSLAFSGDGLGISPMVGRGSGSLLGVSPLSTVGRAYSALGRPGSVISGLRPGARTLSGNLSYHARGRALDITPIRAIALAIRQAFGFRTLELITPWRELDLHHGRPHHYSSAVHAQHSGGNAHIHWAMAQGGKVKHPGRFLVGELGPEILNLGRGDTVTPLDRVPEAATPTHVDVKVFLGTKEITDIINVVISERERRSGTTERKSSVGAMAWRR